MTVLKTIKNKINEWKYVMLSVGIAAGILYFAYGSHESFKETIVNNFNKQQAVLLNSFQNFIRDHIDEARKHLEFIAKYINNKNETTQVPGIISAVYDSYQDDFFSINLLNADGELQLTTPSIPGQHPLNANFIKKTIKRYKDTTAPFISERYTDHDGRHIICIFVPCPAAAQKTHYVMGMIKIEDLIENILLSRGEKGFCFFLADNDGDLFCMVDVGPLHDDMIKGNLFVLKNTCLSCHQQDDFLDIKQAVERNTIVNRVYKYPNAEVTNRTTTAIQVYNERWSMSVCTPYEYIQGTIENNFKKHLLYSLLLILVVGFFGYFTYNTHKRKAVLVAERDNLKKIADTSEALRESEEQLRQAQKMESIGTLAGGIAHDFNNILGAIMGYTELSLAELPEESPVKKMLKKVMAASERARDMVKQILAFSRKNLIEKKFLYIGQIIQEDLKLLRSSLPATIEIRSHIEKELNPVLADLTQLHQVIMNVCINAAQAMREQGGILEITLKEIDLRSGTFNLENIEPGIYQQLTIKDTGHGMDVETIKKIFDPYFTTKKTGEGTGMGLAVVHGIVKSHGGEIVVLSEPGKGSTFHIFFPIAEKAGGQKPGTIYNEPIRGGSERIFLVDDDKNLAEMGKTMLEKLGYRVTFKTSSVEALEYFRENYHNFDMLITDMTMPVLTGLQLAREIHRVNPGIPIVLCTGFSEEINEENFKSRGISAFVMKPIVREQIARVIRQVLD